MISTKRAYITTAAGLAAGIATAGTADAAVVLTSNAGAGYTPVTFTAKTNSSHTNLGSFDTSGSANLNRIDVYADSYSGSGKLTLSGSTVGSRFATNRLTDVHNGTSDYIAAFSDVPAALPTTNTTGGYLSNGNTTNFSSTPMYGFTSYAANGGAATGYFKGTFTTGTGGTTTFTLLDYGTATDDIAAPVAAAVPEPETWALLAAGFGGMGVALRRRRKAGTTAAAAAA